MFPKTEFSHFKQTRQNFWTARAPICIDWVHDALVTLGCFWNFELLPDMIDLDTLPSERRVSVEVLNC